MLRLLHWKKIRPIEAPAWDEADEPGGGLKFLEKGPFELPFLGGGNSICFIFSPIWGRIPF